MKYEYLHPRDELALTLERIYNYKMTTTSGGNLSIKDENGDIWITPARVDKGQLTPKDIVCVRADGSVDGLHPPSSEFPFHKAVYDVRPDIRSVVHAHPMALVAFSCAHKVPETRAFPSAWNSNGKVGFAPYGVPGSADLGAKIAAEFQKGYDSVILENHGVCCGGQNLQDLLRHQPRCFPPLGKRGSPHATGRRLRHRRPLYHLPLATGASGKKPYPTD